jgi:3,4-dihydroxy 2-butanone 4-phosphate synthase/GTP cyclohydrolase II
MTNFQHVFTPIPDLIQEAAQGKMFILVDDEDRENEGDLVIPAQMATAATINFMARYGRGLICLALTRERVEQLRLPLMSMRNETRHQTAFTVSIEAREGIATGISASDRARTVATAIDNTKDSRDIVTPGHVFPLIARDGGVLVRAGHTEAAVDIARLAGLNPSGVICEILNEDGTMARRDDLIKFAYHHQLKIGTIADLIAYRRKYEKVVERKTEKRLHSIYGGMFQMIVYINRFAYAEHIALIKGDITTPGPVLVRMHALNILEDVLGEKAATDNNTVQAAMQLIAAEGRGVIVLIREPSPTSVSSQVIKSLAPTRPDNHELRDYGVGAQILKDIGVSEITLLSNHVRNIVGIEGHGLKIVGHRILHSI